MGVRGLTTYIRNNEDLFLKDFILNDSCLVIDGHSLSAQLYKEVNFYSALGGDYDRYANHIKKFFRNLKKCNIKSYVLFDGSVERRKIRTTLKRMRSKLYGAANLHPADFNSYHIFPLLMRDVFKEVLADLNIEFSTCEFEADEEIAALAKHLKCPVLSYDSDFYIFNVSYIPYVSLGSKPIQISDENCKYGFECKIYKVEHFCSHFDGFNEAHLPLLATLAGNDYVKKKVFNNFHKFLKLPKSKRGKSDTQRLIQGIIDFLKNESLETAINKIVGRLKNKYKPSALAVIEESCESYNNPSCKSIKYFSIDSDINLNKSNDFIKRNQTVTLNSCDEESSDSDDSISTESGVEDTDIEEILPVKLISDIRNGRIPQPYINLFTHHTYFLIPQIEDFNQEDSLLCCKKILRYAFDFITGFSVEDLNYFSREGPQYKRIIISREESLTNPCLKTLLDNEFDESITILSHFLKETLKIDVRYILMLPDNIQILFLSLLWWAKYCTVSFSHIYSVILCFVTLEAIDNRTGHFRGDSVFQKKFKDKIALLQKRNPECDEKEADYYLDKNKVNYEDSLVAASVLLKHFEIDVKKQSKVFNKSKLHKFAQFQCCLQQMNYLNALSDFQLCPTKIYKTYNGTFAFKTYLLLENKQNPFVFLKNHLKGAFTVFKYFSTLCDSFDSLCKEGNIIIHQQTSTKRKKHKKTKESEIEFEITI